MKFPNKLIVILKSSDTKMLIPHHAIYLRIKAPEKNNYDIGLRVTDELGQAVFTEEEIKDEISWTRNSFIMDYASSYEECLSEFSVVLFSKEGLTKCTGALKLYKSFGERVSKDLELIKRAANINLIEQKWSFNSELLAAENGLVHIECFVEGPGLRS